MTALLVVDPGSGRTFARFVLDGAGDAGGVEVSVVGSFNDWVPGAHPLTPQDDGTRGVLVEVRHPGDVYFRYLADGGRWFDDPTAQRVDENGSVLLRGSAQLVDVAVLEPARADGGTARTTTKVAGPMKSGSKKSGAKKSGVKKSGVKESGRKKAGSKMGGGKAGKRDKAEKKEKAAKKEKAGTKTKKSGKKG